MNNVNADIINRPLDLVLRFLGGGALLSEAAFVVVFQKTSANARSSSSSSLHTSGLLNVKTVTRSVIAELLGGDGTAGRLGRGQEPGFGLRSLILLSTMNTTFHMDVRNSGHVDPSVHVLDTQDAMSCFSAITVLTTGVIGWPAIITIVSPGGVLGTDAHVTITT